MSRTHFRSPDEKFLASIEWQGDCLVWTAGMDGAGYGHLWDGGRRRMVKAHRYAWEREHGPIPDGMFIDHVCHNKVCVRVPHLRLATPAQNSRNRGRARSNTGHRNVHFARGLYVVNVGHEGVQHKGWHKTLEEAVAHARALRTELFGEFAGKESEDV